MNFSASNLWLLDVSNMIWIRVHVELMISDVSNSCEYVKFLFYVLDTY